MKCHAKQVRSYLRQMNIRFHLYWHQNNEESKIIQEKPITGKFPTSLRVSNCIKYQQRDSRPIFEACSVDSILEETYSQDLEALKISHKNQKKVEQVRRKTGRNKQRTKQCYCRCQCHLEKENAYQNKPIFHSYECVLECGESNEVYEEYLEKTIRKVMYGGFDAIEELRIQKESKRHHHSFGKGIKRSAKEFINVKIEQAKNHRTDDEIILVMVSAQTPVFPTKTNFPSPLKLCQSISPTPIA